MDMEYYTATVAVDVDGKREYKSYGIITDYNGIDSKVDASPELQEEYTYFLAYQKRKHYVMECRYQRNRDKRLAAACKTDWKTIRFLRERHDEEHVESMIKLVSGLRNNKLRSEFRKSLATQIANWMDTPADQRKFKSPLSPKQMSYILPKRWY